MTVQVRLRVPFFLLMKLNRVLLVMCWHTFNNVLRKYEAAVAQLVEHHVANVNVTSSSLVSRSKYFKTVNLDD